MKGSDGHSAVGGSRARSGSVSEGESDGENGESETGGSTYYFDGSRRLGAGHGWLRLETSPCRLSR